MKLCKDCEYCDGSASLAECRHDLAKEQPHPVDGSDRFCFCTTMRQPYGPCKEAAILFNRKQSISDKMKSKAEQLFGKYWS